MTLRIPLPFTVRHERADHPFTLRWRKSLVAGRFRFGFFVGLENDRVPRGSDEWRRAAGYHIITLRHDGWLWGRQHGFYDGPHDSFCLGPLQFNWQGEWCDKCAEPDEPDARTARPDAGDGGGE